MITKPSCDPQLWFPLIFLYEVEEKGLHSFRHAKSYRQFYYIFNVFSMSLIII